MDINHSFAFWSVNYRLRISSSSNSPCGVLRVRISVLLDGILWFDIDIVNRWRYRIACKIYGKEQGLKAPADHIRLPFPLFSFQYVDRLLPLMDGGGLVLNPSEQFKLEIMQQQKGNDKDIPIEVLCQRDSIDYFTQLPVSREGMRNIVCHCFSACLLMQNDAVYCLCFMFHIGSKSDFNKKTKPQNC